MGLLDGLGKLGLKNFDMDNLYSEPEKEKNGEKQEQKQPEKPTVKETDFIYEKKSECPICDSVISSLTVKSGRAKLLGTDKDLKPVYEGIEPIKYEPIVCKCCGYAVMSRYNKPLTPSQKKAVIENIATSYTGGVESHSDTVSYEEAIQGANLALAAAMVKRAKPSEKAYICLKTGWLYRSFRESLDPAEEDYKIACEELKKKEEEFLSNAYEGFIQARQSEGFPMAGMDETTMDYLLATLALDRNEIDVASRMVAAILQSVNASPRIKDKARELKEEIVAKIKKK